MEKFSGGAISVICGSMLARGEKDISEIKQAVNEIYRLNDALRIRISEDNGEVMQTVSEYHKQDISVLCFENKAVLDRYAESYAKIAVDLYGSLCEINIVAAINNWNFRSGYAMILSQTRNNASNENSRLNNTISQLIAKLKSMHVLMM